MRETYLQHSLDLLIAEQTAKIMRYAADDKARKRDGSQWNIGLRTLEQTKEEYEARLKRRMEESERLRAVGADAPRIAGVCAYVPAPNVLAGDDEGDDPVTEDIAVALAKQYESDNGRTARSVEADGLGFDLRSSGSKEIRYIEVKGRKGNGAVSLTASKSVYRARFGPLLPGVVHAPFGDEDPDLDFIRNHLFKRLVKPDEIAAVVVEPVQGEGGYVFPPDGWLPKLRDLCSQHGILLVADEIQSGMGRTGKMWAVEHWGVEPDIVLAGKGIASGMPLGAMMARGKLMTWPMGAHGSTYGGNPVSCAAALATIDLIEKELIANTVDAGDQLIAGLRELASRQPLIDEVRGLGLMIGIEFGSDDVADAVEIASFRQGLLTLRCGAQTIRMSPPLVVSAPQVRSGLRIFEEACRQVAERGPEAFVRYIGEHEAGPDVPEGA